MPGKRAGSDPRPSVRITRGAGSGQHLASVLEEGLENANINAGLGFIWRIFVKIILLRGSRAVSAHVLRWRIPTDGSGLATTHTAGAESFCLEMCEVPHTLAWGNRGKFECPSENGKEAQS
jgi:hypothetical protein